MGSVYQYTFHQKFNLIYDVFHNMLLVETKQVYSTVIHKTSTIEMSVTWLPEGADTFKFGEVVIHDNSLINDQLYRLSVVLFHIVREAATLADSPFMDLLIPLHVEEDNEYTSL